MHQNVLNYKAKIFCNRCGVLTNHICKGEHQDHYTELSGPSGEPTGWWEESTYRLMICAGCETATLEISYTNAAMYDHQQQDQYHDVSYHPKRTQSGITEKRFRQLPGPLVKIYGESVEAFNAKLYVLCAAGLRALIEGICKDKGITGRNLEKRIDGLEELLPKNIVDNLHSFRFMGNDAVHELNAPDVSDLKIAIEICEDLLNYLYELDYKTQRLATNKKSKSKAKSAT